MRSRPKFYHTREVFFIFLFTLLFLGATFWFVGFTQP